MNIKSEKLRGFFAIVLAIIVMIFAFFIAWKIVNSKKQVKPVSEKSYKTIFADTVSNETMPIFYESNGNIEAVRKVELYAEVQGIFHSSSSKNFRPGEQYSKGSTLVNIDAAEFKANLISQRSTLYNQIATAIPDLKIDYKDIAPKWQDYLNSIDISKTIPPLPSFSNDKEKYYITGQNILTSYYNVKNLEERLQKYTIVAPFSGTLTEALVTPGALVRSGQKLGEFIDASQFELKVDVPKSYTHLLTVGKKASLVNADNQQEWDGEVVRVNAIVNPGTQSVEVFLRVSGEGLKDGMYLEAKLALKEEESAFKISRKLLVDNQKIFTVVNDSLLELVDIQPVYLGKETAIIKGLEDGTIILNNILPGAYPGMLVKITE